MFRVLIVDDEPIIKKSITKLIQMEHSNFKIINTADNGKEALQIAEKELPDLVITDVRMPGMDGIQLIKKLSNLKKKMKVVMISGYDEFDYVQKALRFGAVDYILKPIKPSLFHEVIQKVEVLLHQDNLLKPETRDWLWKQKKVADELIEAIWNVDFQSCKNQLRIFTESNEYKAMELYTIKQFYKDLGRFINKEINSKLKSNSAEFPYLIEQSDSIEEAYEGLVAHIEQLCNLVQESRNWSCFSKVGQAVLYIDNNFNKVDLTLQEVADDAGMSASYFSKQFKEEKGISFIHYLTKFRINRAQQLLKDLSLKTYEVADQVGYADYPHFAKTFKKYTGSSPKEYRKNLLQIKQ